MFGDKICNNVDYCLKNKRRITAKTGAYREGYLQSKVYKLQLKNSVFLFGGFMVHRIGCQVPDTGDAAFIAWNAEVSGSARLGKNASVWFGAVVRADLQPITIGDCTNIQDNATLHVTMTKACTIGSLVSVGHNAVIHAATVGDECIIGIGAIILNGAVIGSQSIVGAGALVTEDKVFPPRSLIFGSPARLVRSLREEEIQDIRATAERYAGMAREAATGYGEIK